MILGARSPFWRALQFTDLERGTGRRSDSGGSKFDLNITNDTSLAKLFEVLEPQFSPESVPGE